MTSRVLSLSVHNNLCMCVCRKRVRNTSTNGERVRSYNLRPEDVEGINPEFGKWYYTPRFNRKNFSYLTFNFL